MPKPHETFRPWWFADALAQHAPSVAPSLSGHTSADVCIVGGGYTGLWTAIMLKQSQPELDIVVLERDLCGSGASGRNGGCMLTLAPKFFTLQRLFGTEQAVQIVQASENAVFAIRDFCLAHAIEAQVRVDGALYTATNEAQRGSMSAVMAALAQQNINSWCDLTPEETVTMAASAKHLEGVFSPVGGSLHPGLLVLGLVRLARQLGVRIYEQSAMTELLPGQVARVQTAQGEVSAKRVVLALNAWMAGRFREFSRSIAIVSSDMIITEPCPELLAQMGLQHGAAVCDSRIFVHYYRSTSDGRLMLGKGGNTFAYGGKMLASFEQPSRYQAQLCRTLHEFFPALEKVTLAASWNGASDRSVTGLPFFGRWRGQDNVFYGFGYSGNGVTTSYLGGQILASLVRGEKEGWVKCALVSGALGHFPPEPIRWIGSLMVRNAIRRVEQAQDQGQIPATIDLRLAKFAQAAGKADKADKADKAA